MKAMIITGASSGIGRNLAYEFAKRGYSLGLIARRFSNLQEIRKDLHSQFGTDIKIEIRSLDVTNFKNVFSVLKDMSISLGGISHVVANAGVAGSNRVGSGEFLRDKMVIETNLLGAMATVEAAAELFKSSDTKGHIIGISSIAGFRGFPGDASYCASKAALTVYLESARRDLKKNGILVTTILPGFIDTDINSHLPIRPFVVSAKKGAEKLAVLIERRVHVSTLPVFPWNIIGLLLKGIPDFIWQRLKFER